MFNSIKQEKEDQGREKKEICMHCSGNFIITSGKFFISPDPNPLYANDDACVAWRLFGEGRQPAPESKE